MTTSQVQFDYADSSDSRFDTVIFALLGGMVFFAPLALGAVQAWSEAIIIAAAVTMLLVLGIKLLVRADVPFIIAYAYFPLVLFIAWCLLQLLPMPNGLLGILSPATVSVRAELLADLGGSESGAISLYSETTIRTLRMVVVWGIVFVVTVNVFRSLAAFRRVLTIVAIAGVTVSTIAIAQQVMDAKSIYGVIPAWTGMARGGPFMVPSHFCQFANLSIGAGAALVLMSFHEHLHRTDYSRAELRAKLTSAGFAPAWIGVLAIVLGLVAITGSGSRMGLLSAVVAGAVTLALTMIRRPAWSPGWLTVIMLLVVLGGGVWGGYDLTFSRFEELFERGDGIVSRLEILRSMAPAFDSFGWAGTGLGTFQFVFPQFDQSVTPFVASHAENEYAQLLFETGRIGVAIVSVFVMLLALRWAQLVFGAGNVAVWGMIGLTYGFVAILVHSASDFGQHLPANFIVTAIASGLVLNLYALSRKYRRQVSPGIPQRGRRMLRMSGMIVAALCSAMLIHGAVMTMLAERHAMASARLEVKYLPKPAETPNEVYRDLIVGMERAVALRSGDVEHRYYLSLYRWVSITRFRDDETGEVKVGWLVPENPSEGPQRFREFCERIIAELQEARRLAPSYAPALVLMAEIEHFSLKKEGSDALVEKGWTLARNDARGSFNLALLRIEQGRADEAIELIRRASRLESGRARLISDLLVEELNRADLALELAGDDRSELARVAAQSGDPAIIAEAKRRSLQSLEKQIQARGGPAAALVELARLKIEESKFDEAIELYKRAVRQEYSAINWRVELAELLERAGKLDEALEEAERILRDRNQESRARDLISRVQSLRSPATKPVQ